jgi:hypothetical protein
VVTLQPVRAGELRAVVYKSAEETIGCNPRRRVICERHILRTRIGHRALQPTYACGLRVPLSSNLEPTRKLQPAQAGDLRGVAFQTQAAVLPIATHAGGCIARIFFCTLNGMGGVTTHAGVRFTRAWD